jgi:hypothetical protein
MASRESKNLVSVGLVMMPHWLRVAASRVGWARRERLRPPRRRMAASPQAWAAGQPEDIANLDASDAHAHESADLEQLETNRAAGCFGKMRRKAQSST